MAFKLLVTLQSGAQFTLTDITRFEWTQTSDNRLTSIQSRHVSGTEYEHCYLKLDQVVAVVRINGDKTQCLST